MFATYVRGSEQGEWEFEREVSLVRILADQIDRQSAAKSPSKDDSLPWEMPGRDLRKAVSNEFELSGNSNSRKVVIDATWGREDALLLEIANVFGFSDPSWTPLMFQLIPILEEEKRPNGPETPIERFRFDDDCSQEYIHEFLYLQCGHAKGLGKRSWGRVGLTNAALLWPAAFEYFMEKAGFVRLKAAGASKL